MIDRFLEGLAGKMEDPVEYRFMTVSMPGDLDPFERHERFAAPIDAELRLTGAGCCSGGGTLYTNVDFEADEPGENEEATTILDINATDTDGALALLRRHLTELGAPPGTAIQYGGREDRFDGGRWHLGERLEDEE